MFKRIFSDRFVYEEKKSYTNNLVRKLLPLLIATLFWGCGSGTTGAQDQDEVEFDPVELEQTTGDHPEDHDAIDTEIEEEEIESPDKVDTSEDEPVDVLDADDSTEASIETETVLEEDIEASGTEEALEDETTEEWEIVDNAEPEPEPEVFRCTSGLDPWDFWTAWGSSVFTEEWQSSESSVTFECRTNGYRIAGAKGMEVEVELTARGRLKPLRGRLLAGSPHAFSQWGETATYGDASMETVAEGERVGYRFSLPRSGEYAIGVIGYDNEAWGDYTLRWRCVSGCGRKFTRHPIVLIHGMGGFDAMLGGVLNYFFDVEETLEDEGYEVFTTDAAMFNTSIARSEEIEKQLISYLSETGADKFNIVAHSQGGIDSRILIHDRDWGHRVAVLATISTPHRGSYVAEGVLGLVPELGEDILAGLMDAAVEFFIGHEQDLEASMETLRTDYMMDVFNPAHPDDPRVTYWSWAGRTCARLEISCREDNNGEVVLDVLYPTYAFLRSYGPHAGFNDGMVPVDSAKWGEFHGMMTADHGDEIGLFYRTNLFFDHLEFYSSVAQKLFDEGF